MPIERDDMTAEERAFAEGASRSSWGDPDHDYHNRDLDGMVGLYAPDAISIPANHPAMQGHDAIRAWYERRTGDYEMNMVSEVDSVDVVGDIAVLVGIFRATRSPEEGVVGLDHGGRFLAVMRRIDGEWKMWRDMDTPSPDADVFYDRLPRGW